MAAIQTRDSVGDSSDDEPLSKLMKCKPPPERTQYLEETTLAVDGTSGSGKKSRSSASPATECLEDASPKETTRESAAAAESPGHSSDCEPLNTLLKAKRPAPGSRRRHQRAGGKESSDSEDDQPVLTLIKKKAKGEESVTLDAKCPKRRKMTARVSKLRQSPPSQVNPTQKRGRKGKAEAKRTTSAPSAALNQATTRRGRPKKAHAQPKAPSSDMSDDEPVSLQARETSQPETKRMVVVLKRMSKRDVLDAIAQGRARRSQHTGPSAAAADGLLCGITSAPSPSVPAAGAGSPAESSDEEPLSHALTRLKRQSRTAGGTVTAETALAEDLKDGSGDKRLGERQADEMPSSPHRESSSS